MFIIAVMKFKKSLSLTRVDRLFFKYIEITYINYYFLKIKYGN